MRLQREKASHHTLPLVLELPPSLRPGAQPGPGPAPVLITVSWTAAAKELEQRQGVEMGPTGQPRGGRLGAVSPLKDAQRGRLSLGSQSDAEKNAIGGVGGGCLPLCFFLPGQGGARHGGEPPAHSTQSSASSGLSSPPLGSCLGEPVQVGRTGTYPPAPQHPLQHEPLPLPTTLTHNPAWCRKGLQLPLSGWSKDHQDQEF